MNLTRTSTKLTGKACSLLVMVRNFPLIFENLLDELENSQFSDLGEYIVNVCSFVELIMSPTLTINEICGILGPKAKQLLDMRQDLGDIYEMSNIRPKHHFTSHYDLYFLLFGPLIQQWTMRFEQKHTRIKSIVRTSMNFTNVVKTISERLQKGQSSLSFEGLFKLGKPVPPENSADIKTMLENDSVDNDVRMFISSLPDTASVCRSINIRGLTYACGKLVLSSVSDECNTIVVNYILLVSLCNEEVTFLCDQTVAKRDKKNYFFKSSPSEVKIVKFRKEFKKLQLVLIIRFASSYFNRKQLWGSRI